MKPIEPITSAVTKGASKQMEFVTVMVAGQLLGLPISRVHDVFVVSEMTTVPLAPGEIAGLLNLRGRVVTAVSLRRRLGLGDAGGTERRMAVGLENHGEAYGLLVDEVGEVLKLDPDGMQPNPVHMDRGWVGLSQGVHQLHDKLLIVLDVDAVLAFETEREAA
ncbi:chemotaxis protein CheW [Microvirga lotononidis]|uniref:Chemotaxis signal transduction protein n=1 Tax=Microvirga lotononidis TaxID=864069 RepID=I4YLV5_9HYPH|nr:chemotaxis protein CheW [Microvirga lotononidis]EIM24947.1 chemotaxis signal transduction protein [Microvirga lotononidis]WQO29801.1 chemotaxis protein CheW [Microvirga lotononidis]